MSFAEKFKKYVPPTTSFFTIDIVGATTKFHYQGDFTCKIPTMKDRSLIGRNKGALNEGLELDTSVLILHHILSYLKYTITEAPAWWKESDNGNDLFDLNVIERVYDAVLTFENDWQKEIWGDPIETLAKDEEVPLPAPTPDVT